eukprot:989806-Pyramimonas_sp.AAC.1
MQPPATSGWACPNQYCPILERYFTQDLHDAFASDTVDEHTAAPASFTCKLGTACPAEQILKRAGAIIQLAALRNPTLACHAQQRIAKTIQEVVKAMG